MCCSIIATDSAILNTPEITSSSYRKLVRNHYYNRKKSSSRLSGWCAIVITTGKKSSSLLSGGCAIAIMTGKKKF